ncbi:hypothetical protein L6452_06701 [Arctium lappa]|uniref:Uncharacterized protein n=1 Tax=Arctium lappa TaxID=4217 RepID=A0ACB9EKB3_ARCLA|nr:hypothetical protein L6452_06701 [Arctium lappa]
MNKSMEIERRSRNNRFARERTDGEDRRRSISTFKEQMGFRGADRFQRRRLISRSKSVSKEIAGLTERFILYRKMFAEAICGCVEKMASFGSLWAFRIDPLEEREEGRERSS